MASLLIWGDFYNCGTHEEGRDVICLPTGSYYLTPRFVTSLYPDEVCARLRMQVISGWRWDRIDPEDLRNQTIDVVGLCIAVNCKEGFTDIKNKVRNYVDLYQSDLRYAPLILIS